MQCVLYVGFGQGLVTDAEGLEPPTQFRRKPRLKVSFLPACTFPIFFNIQLSFNKTKQNPQRLIFDIAAILFLDSIQQVLAEAARNLISN